MKIRWVPHPLRPTKLFELTFGTTDAKGGLDHLRSLPALFSPSMNAVAVTLSLFPHRYTHPLRPQSALRVLGWSVGRKGWGTHGIVC